MGRQIPKEVSLPHLPQHVGLIVVKVGDQFSESKVLAFPGFVLFYTPSPRKIVWVDLLQIKDRHLLTNFPSFTRNIV